MAHQAHSIPWSVLVSNFSYDRHTSGSKKTGNADIFALDKPTQSKSLIHFAKEFARTLREYARIERSKLQSQESYRRRAKDWTSTDDTSDEEQCFASGQENKSAHRKVISDDDRERWASDRHPFYSAGQLEETQFIDEWIFGENHWNSIPNDNNDAYDVARRRNNSRDYWVTLWTDDFKWMMLEASLTTIPLHERQAQRDKINGDHARHLDTLFLLVNHPSIHVKQWIHEGDGCCNIQSGLICIVEAALIGYIYFNMLYAMRENGSKVCQLTKDTFGAVDGLNRSHPHKHRKLEQRPRYMNTRSWSRLSDTILRQHQHHVQIIAFYPYLYPTSGQNFGTAYSEDSDVFADEVDVMTPAPEQESMAHADPLQTRGSSAALHEFLRGLWKLMVICEMLWTDMDCPPNWEVMIAWQMEQVFQGISHKRYRLFWNTRDDESEHRYENLFDGSYEPEPFYARDDIAESSQQKKHKAIKREARREARTMDKLSSRVRQVHGGG